MIPYGAENEDSTTFPVPSHEEVRAMEKYYIYSILGIVPWECVVAIVALEIIHR